MYNTANYLKHIFSFCITTYTFTVIWRPGRSWGCLVSWARGWWAGKTAPTLHLSLPTFCSILPYKVLTWVCGHTVSVLQPCSINILLQTLAPGPGACRGAHQWCSAFPDGGPRIETLAGTITSMGWGHWAENFQVLNTWNIIWGGGWHGFPEGKPHWPCRLVILYKRHYQSERASVSLRPRLGPSALEGRFLTTGPPGKSGKTVILSWFQHV